MDYQEQLKQFYAINQQRIIGDGLPWSRYILLPVADPQRPDVQKLIIGDPRIKRIVTKLEYQLAELDVQHQTPVDFRVYGSYYWWLRFLADIGLSSEVYGIGPLLRKLERNQLEDGSFMIGYNARKRQAMSLVCVTAHLAYCLRRLEGSDSRAFWAACHHLLATQRNDGGWHCGAFPLRHDRGEQGSSCFGATITALLTLGQVGDKPWHSIQAAIHFCLKCLESQRVSCGCGGQQPAFDHTRLRYPPHHTGGDILNIIQGLSFFPQLLAPGALQPLITALLQRWDGVHWLPAEKEIPEWAIFNFSQKGQPSDWLTALVLCAIQRINDSQGSPH